MNNILAKQIDEHIGSLYRQIDNYRKLRDVIERLPLPETEKLEITSYYSVDYNHPTREDFTILRAAFPQGTKWSRNLSYDGSNLDYTTTVEGITFRAWHCPPPPTCQVVYEEIVIPAQPERIEKRAKVLCKPSKEVTEENEN